MDAKEKFLRRHIAKVRNTDTGDLDLEEVYDTGANAVLWGKRTKAVKANSRTVARLMGRGITDTGSNNEPGQT